MVDVDDGIISKQKLINLLVEKTGCAHIGLPRDIDFYVKDSTLNVNVLNPAHNMQTNEAAFEGWILSLKAHLEDKFKNVVLDYRFPRDVTSQRFGNSKVCHYNRFLYRINNFKRLFPDWFTLSDSKTDEVAVFMDWLKRESCILNHSLRERKSVIRTKNMERQVESWFVFEDGKQTICEFWGLDRTKLFNQLPVGVFRKSIAQENAIFTRGAGAVDIWGVGKDGITLHIVELKYGDNNNMGVIGEVLFYAAVLYDTCIVNDTLFKFGRYRNYSKTTDMIAIQNEGNKYQQLHAHLLAEHYHRLFSENVANLISKGLSKLDVKFDRAIYNYEKKSPIHKF